MAACVRDGSSVDSAGARDSTATTATVDSLSSRYRVDVGSAQFPMSHLLGSLATGAPPAILEVKSESCVPGKCACSARFAPEWKLETAAIRDSEISTCTVADFDGDGDWDASLPGAEGKSVMVFMQDRRPESTWYLDGGAVAELYEPRPTQGLNGEPPTKYYTLRDEGSLLEWRDSLFVRVTFVTPTVIPSQGDLVINEGGIGRVRLGRMLDEARLTMPTASFKRTSDGDGAALVEVTLGPDTSLVIYAGEHDAQAPITWTGRIEHVEAFSTAFHTQEGVRPGALVSDVVKVYGKVTEIMLSEIESRQYVTFEKQPAWLTFRLDYTGVFAPGSRRTTKYEPGARIHSISVSR